MISIAENQTNQIIPETDVPLAGSGMTRTLLGEKETGTGTIVLETMISGDHLEETVLKEAPTMMVKL